MRERRRDLGLTLNEASRAIGLSRSHLNLIELGKATGVSRDAVARIDAGLDAQGGLLALLPSDGEVDPRDTPKGDEMRRADFNRAVVAFAAALLFDPGRLIESRDEMHVDAALLDDLESLTAELARRQHHGRPQAILPPIRAHLRYLLDLDSVSAAPSLQPRLARVTAQSAALAGWVAFRGTGDLVTAHGQLALARERAREAGDDTLTAQLLAASSSLYSSLDLPRVDQTPGSPLALSMLRAAQRKASSSSASLRGWLAARISEEEALLGEGRRARAALARAEATLPSAPRSGQGGLFVIWDETRFPGYAGKTLLILRDPAATPLLERALAATTAPHPRLGLLVDLALARVRDRQPEEAVSLLVEGAALAIKRGIDGFARWRLQEGRAGLPAVHQRAFDSRLQALA